MSIGLDAAINSATSMVVGRLVSTEVGKTVTGGPYMAGRYTFDIVRSITPGSAGRITVYVEGLRPSNYGDLPVVSVGSDYLLLMRKDSTGALQITDPAAPLVYLGHYLPSPTTPKTSRECVLSIIAASLEDRDLRNANIGALEQARYAPLVP